MPMRSCGCDDMAQRLLDVQILGAAGEVATDGPEVPDFALPGDTAMFAPDRPADVRHVEIRVALDFAEKRVRGDVITHFTALFEEVREVTLDAAELQIEAVTLADADSALAFWAEGERLRIRLDRAYAHGEEFAVRVRYEAQPRVGLVFVAPTAGDPTLPVQAWTQGETEYHHFWFPCHDFPNDRATTALHATVPSDYFVLSNGVLAEVIDHADGTKTYSWRMDVAFPAYLVTLVAGTFSELRDTWRDVPCNAYVPVGREEDGRRM
ncbi:MAG: hypothetical protein IVW57_06540, partial [Ktedonobacterales bacterium]|nr:hypothetical protein [Ktedonobacterales bacterium]